MFTIQVVPWHRRLDRQSSKREVVGSSPAVGKKFSFCNSCFLCVPHSLTKPFVTTELNRDIHLTYTLF